MKPASNDDLSLPLSIVRKCSLGAGESVLRSVPVGTLAQAVFAVAHSVLLYMSGFGGSVAGVSERLRNLYQPCRLLPLSRLVSMLLADNHVRVLVLSSQGARLSESSTRPAAIESYMLCRPRPNDFVARGPCKGGFVRGQRPGAVGSQAWRSELDHPKLPIMSVMTLFCAIGVPKDDAVRQYWVNT